MRTLAEGVRILCGRDFWRLVLGLLATRSRGQAHGGVGRATGVPLPPQVRPMWSNGSRRVDAQFASIRVHARDIYAPDGPHSQPSACRAPGGDR